jgi:hypothetical protein
MNEFREPYVKAFATLFAGNGTAYGTEDGGCVRSAPTLDILNDHLFGSKWIGIYPCDRDQAGDLYCKWGCVDYDEGDEVSFEKAKRLIFALRAIGIPAYPERSRSKGWHVWVFAAEPVLAATMRRALLAACQVAQAESKEVNPKSEELPEGSLGNYVRLPYPCGPKNEGRRMVYSQVDSGEWFDSNEDRGIWSPMPLEDFLQRVQLASPARLEVAAARWRQPPTVPLSTVGLSQDEDEPEALLRLLPGLAYTIWKEGPLDGADRSSTLLRFAREVHAYGFTPEQAFQLLCSADRRWGKYLARPGGEREIEKIVRRFYQ